MLADINDDNKIVRIDTRLLIQIVPEALVGLIGEVSRDELGLILKPRLLIDYNSTDLVTMRSLILKRRQLLKAERLLSD